MTLKINQYINFEILLSSVPKGLDQQAKICDQFKPRKHFKKVKPNVNTQY